ncbi:MAG: carbon-nitrogen hydrolase family protein [Desulforhopalus sp.]
MKTIDMEITLHVGLAQTRIASSPEENLQTARRWVAQAAERGMDLIAFPEMFMGLPGDGITPAALAQPLDGQFVTALSALAAEYSIAIICGCWESDHTNPHKAANIAIALGPDGSLIARYHKIHLFDALNVRESKTMTAGHTPPPVFTLNGLKVGLAICYDLRFPELFRNLAQRGAEAVLVPSAWYAGPLKEDHWLTLLKARAVENTLYVCGINLCGGSFSARSAIVDPFGATLAGSGEQEALVCARLTQKRVREIRTKLPVLTHIRTDLFHD